ncbi:uncharacterized protein KY384_008660 [Bacidia gigantensis]|uniref:uncharacterized protein n=1 Tax=Bacidia gigantensis TaxID=2732470 RepID=UPI001D052577|nr:uncharacterized protein KY384_008660 [Bacidia gigantensis]KAG8527230.1 hypothetical protein KY384_008660 [Bacidia gigantensis]
MWTLFFSFPILAIWGAVPVQAFGVPLINTAPDPSGDSSPTDTSWIKQFTALGDSYAAGMGVGNQVDSACSRYYRGYPDLLKNVFVSDATFQNIACSGHTSVQIEEKAKELPDHSQDLITVSAGGNDVFLSEVLKTCVYSLSSKQDCEAAIKKTQDAIADLEPHIKYLLDTLQAKIKDKGIIAYTLYAKFFDDSTESCTSEVYDTVKQVLNPEYPPVDKDLRGRLNDLVYDTNVKLRNAIGTAQARKGSFGGDFLAVEWDQYVSDVGGRFCEDGDPDLSDNNPNDPNHPGLVFQRLSTGDNGNIPKDKQVVNSDDNSNRKRGVWASISRRRLPDFIASVFHPTELGQKMIAISALQAVVETMYNRNPSAPAGPCSKIDPRPAVCKLDSKAGSSVGITADNYKKASEDWCKDTSKNDYQSQDYGKGLWFNLVKFDHGNCPQDDCFNTLYKLWTQCSAGTLHGDLQLESPCGVYRVDTFDVPDTTKRGDCGKEGQLSCSGIYKVTFSVDFGFTGGKVTWESDDDLGTKLGSGEGEGDHQTTNDFTFTLGGHDLMKVIDPPQSKQPWNPMDVFSFQYKDDEHGKTDTKTYKGTDKEIVPIPRKDKTGAPMEPIMVTIFSCEKQPDDGEVTKAVCTFNAKVMNARATPNS